MNDKQHKTTSLIPEDVRSLGRVYGFSVEGYVNFEAERVRETTLETTPLMKAIEAARPARESGKPTQAESTSLKDQTS